ncbi:MAG: SLC13 family permease [Nitrososphaerales archaeon]
MVLINIFESIGLKIHLGISEIALLGATLLLFLSSRRREILKRLDWSVLVLFAALFVLMQAVMGAGIVAQIASYLPSLSNGNPSSSLLGVLASSVLLSQVVSNVPKVALYLPVMKAAGYRGVMH